MKLTMGQQWIYYGLLLTLILEYVRPYALQAIKANTFVPLLIFSACVISKSGPKFFKIILSRNGKLLLFFTFLMSISVFTADVTFYSYTKLEASIGYFFIFIIITKTLTDIRKIKGAFIVLILCHIVLIILNPDVVLKPETRSYIDGVTFLGDGNDFALSLGITVPFSLCLLSISTHKLEKIFYSTLLLIVILAIIGTQSRGASLALGGTIFFFWIKSKKKGQWILVISLFALIISVYASDQYFNRMSTITNYENEGSAMGRINAWKAGYKMLIDHPIFGVSSGHFPLAYGRWYREGGSGKWLTAHSMYVLAMGELGFPGLFFLLAFILLNLRNNEKLIRAIRSSSNRDPPSEQEVLLLNLNGSMIFFSIGGAFLSVLYYPHIFVLGGLFQASYNICQQKKADNNTS